MNEKLNEIAKGSFLRVNEEGKAYWGQSEGGGSVPKPLTYDYMPEGYPSKSVGTVTLMEEQELVFANMGGAYRATAPVKIDVSDGQTYTIVWDGVEYSCVGHVASDTNYIGNPAAFGAESTGEPFLYTTSGSQYLWISYDTSTSHTICITTQATVYEKIDEKYLPESVFTDAEWDFVSNRPFFNKPLNVNITAENITKDIKAGLNYIDLGVTAPDFNEGLYYKVEGEISFLNNSANTSYTLQINGYYRANSSAEISLGTVYDEYKKENLDVSFYGNNNTYGYAGKLLVSSSGSTRSYTITANFAIISEVKQLSGDYIPNTIQRVGDDVIIPSSTPDSTKKFKITVDDSGTLSAVQV